MGTCLADVGQFDREIEKIASLVYGGVENLFIRTIYYKNIYKIG